MTKTTELARNAYLAYGAVTGNRNYRGEPMPAWDELGETIQAAWRGAVVSVISDVKAILNSVR
jgi:hypothetical protein